MRNLHFEVFEGLLIGELLNCVLCACDSYKILIIKIRVIVEMLVIGNSKKAVSVRFILLLQFFWSKSSVREITVAVHIALVKVFVFVE